MPASGTAIDLSWNGNQDATSFIVQEAPPDSPGQWTTIATVTDPVYTVTDLTPGGTFYSFRVAAANSAGISAWAGFDSDQTGHAQTYDIPPTIVNGPTATDTTVTGIGTTLSALGADEDGTEANLTYTWLDR